MIDDIMGMANRVKDQIDNTLIDWLEWGEEDLLAAREPFKYDLYVNGIRRIEVQDGNSEHVIYKVTPYGLLTKYDKKILDV